MSDHRSVRAAVAHGLALRYGIEIAAVIFVVWLIRLAITAL